MKRLSVLMAAAFVDMVGFAMIFPLLPFYALRLQAPEWLIGWMIASYSVAQLASAPTWGRLSDRYGRRRSILLGLSASGVAFLVFGFATSIWMLFASRLVQGLGGGITGVLQAYVSDVTEPRDRARALGWLSAATGAGVMIGPAIGSVAFGLGPEWPGIVAAMLCALNIMFARRWLPESSRKSAGPASGQVRNARSIKTMLWEVLRHPNGVVARLVWIYALGMLGQMSVSAVLALYLKSGFGVTERTIFLFFVYIGGLGVIVRAVLLGRLLDWLGETRLMRAGAAIFALGMFTIPLPDSALALGILLGTIPVGAACLFPAVTALVTHRIGEHERGQALGVQQAFGGGARVLAPIWSTAAFQGLGHAFPFYLSGAVATSVLMLAMAVKEVPEPAQAPAEARAAAG
ncbi:MAG TPA: MFS transporter [Gemmatimonadales bacterium]|nr:MFS transporter [Gemmatimonadales bacterium]